MLLLWGLFPGAKKLQTIRCKSCIEDTGRYAKYCADLHPNTSPVLLVVENLVTPGRLLLQRVLQHLQAPLVSQRTRQKVTAEGLQHDVTLPAGSGQSQGERVGQTCTPPVERRRQRRTRWESL